MLPLFPMILDGQKLQKLHKRLTGFGVSSGLSRSDAEDCAQETALVLMRKYPDKDEADAVPLAFRIVRWKILEHRRRNSTSLEGRSVSLEDLDRQPPAEGSRNPEEIAILKEAVYRALDTLGGRCRRLLLWQLEGLTGEEIARKAGLSTRNAAYIAMYRCKKRFRRAYQSLQRRPAREK